LPTVLDSSVLIAAARSSEAHHEAAVAAMVAHEPGGLVLPVTVLTETLAFHRRRWGVDIERVTWERIAASSVKLLEIDGRILRRARAIDDEYADVGFGFVDATILACCEEARIATVLSLDRRLTCYRPSFASALQVLP
jgi:predicted nucleic acid-binding protein